MIKQLHKQHYQLHLLLTSLTSFLAYIYELQPQIRKSWDSMENANKKRK